MTGAGAMQFQPAPNQQMQLSPEQQIQELQKQLDKSNEDIRFVFSQLDIANQNEQKAVKDFNDVLTKCEQQSYQIATLQQQLQQSQKKTNVQAMEVSDFQQEFQQVTSQLEIKDQQIADKDQQIHQIQQSHDNVLNDWHYKHRQILDMQRSHTDQQFQHEQELLEEQIRNCHEQQQKLHAQQLMWMQMEAITEQDVPMAQMIAAQKGFGAHEIQLLEGQIQEKQVAMLRSQASQRFGGVTALMIAAQQGRHELIPYLLEEARRQDTTDDETALMYASEAGQIECVRVLAPLEGGIQSLSNFKKTALRYACDANHVECVQVLAPLEGRLKNEWGDTVLVRMVKTVPNPTDLQLLCVQCLAKAEEGEKENADEWSPLRLAVECGHMDYIPYLAGEIGRKDKEGNTALHIACRKNNAVAVQLLIEEVDCMTGDQLLVLDAVAPNGEIRVSIEQRKSANQAQIESSTDRMHARGSYTNTAGRTSPREGHSRNQGGVREDERGK